MHTDGLVLITLYSIIAFINAIIAVFVSRPSGKEFGTAYVVAASHLYLHNILI